MRHCWPRVGVGHRRVLDGLWAAGGVPRGLCIGRSWGIRARRGGSCWALHSKVITVPPVAGSLIVQGEECESFPVFGGGLCLPQTLLLSDTLSLMSPGACGMMPGSVVGHRWGRWWQLSSSCCGSGILGVGTGGMNPGKAQDTPVSPQVCHPPDEANPEGPCPRHLHQTTGGGEGEEGQLRPGGEAPAFPSLCSASLYLHKQSQV